MPQTRPCLIRRLESVAAKSKRLAGFLRPAAHVGEMLRQNLELLPLASAAPQPEPALTGDEDLDRRDWRDKSRLAPLRSR